MAGVVFKKPARTAAPELIASEFSFRVAAVSQAGAEDTVPADAKYAPARNICTDAVTSRSLAAHSSRHASCEQVGTALEIGRMGKNAGVDLGKRDSVVAVLVGAEVDVGDVSPLVVEVAAATLDTPDEKRRETIAVYDFGGGRFEISILDVRKNVAHALARQSDNQLGGDDIDDVLVDWLAKECRHTNGIDVGKDKVALQVLREAAEKAKIQLSNVPEASIQLPFLTVGWGGAVHLDVRLSRARFEHMIAPLVARTWDLVQRALAESKRSVSDIDAIFLVGGSTSIPLVKESAKRFFGKDPRGAADLDKLGAAVEAGTQTGDRMGAAPIESVQPGSRKKRLGGIETAPTAGDETRAPETLSTVAQGHASVEIHVTQREGAGSKYSRVLAHFRLDEIATAPTRVAKLELSFESDANGIVSVLARGKGHKVVISTGVEDLPRGARHPSSSSSTSDGHERGPASREPGGDRGIPDAEFEESPDRRA